jgi:hypothetical protein
MNLIIGDEYLASFESATSSSSITLPTGAIGKSPTSNENSEKGKFAKKGYFLFNIALSCMSTAAISRYFLVFI